METIKIAGVKRNAFGKKESKAVRKEGMVPCVIYGNGETIHFAVETRSLRPLIYTPQSYLVEFDIDGKKEVGVMREVQYHPVTDNVLHVDFFHVIPGKPISIDVPVKLTGNSEGVKLGEHKGFPYYTIGQRKGLEIALGKPAYVLKINPQKNTVMLGDAEQLKAGYMLAEEENLTDEDEFFGSEELTVRIRYRSKPIPCTVKRLEDGRLLVHFLSEASAIAPGQSAVFYVGRRVVGGSFIASQRGIGMFL